MDFRKHLRLMAEWNTWCHQRVHAAVGRVDDEQYRRPSGLFFRSLHGTLNHLLLVEQVWLGRLKGVPFVVNGLDEEIETDRARLFHRQIASSCEIAAYVDASTDEVLDSDLEFTLLSGGSAVLQRSAVVHTLFTHGTHHRGQVTTVLTQLGLDAPVLDYPRYLMSITKDSART